MKKYFFIPILFSISNVFAQGTVHEQLKTEFVNWDPVRGLWLIESIEAMYRNQPVPTRNFPEGLTPMELFSMIPSTQRNKITRVANQSNNYNFFFSKTDCQLKMGRSYGDPHIKTFDGTSYSFQTVGEYILAKSTDSKFEIQSRQKSHTEQVSVNTATAMNVFGDIVGIYASDNPGNASNTPIRVNGRSILIQNEIYFLPNGGTIQKNGNEYIITWPTGEKVSVVMATIKNMNFLNISVFVYDCFKNYFGLLGNANGNRNDDFNVHNISGLATSTLFTPFNSRNFDNHTNELERSHLEIIANEHGGRYLINSSNTLFEYTAGRNSSSFYDPTFPSSFITLGDIPQVERDKARITCERRGIHSDDIAQCVLDVAHANMQPTSSPSVPNRTTGLILSPLNGNRPNSNGINTNTRNSRRNERYNNNNTNQQNRNNQTEGNVNRNNTYNSRKQVNSGRNNNENQNSNTRINSTNTINQDSTPSNSRSNTRENQKTNNEGKVINEKRRI